MVIGQRGISHDLHVHNEFKQVLSCLKHFSGQELIIIWSMVVAGHRAME
jgi:hypothetical protein